MKKQNKEFSVKAYVIGTVFRFLCVFFVLASFTMFVLVFQLIKIPPSYEQLVNWLNVHLFFEYGWYIAPVIATFVSMIWMLFCKKRLPNHKGTKRVFYLSVVAFVLTAVGEFIAIVPVRIGLVSGWLMESWGMCLQMLFITSIWMFLIADVWNTIDIVLKHRKKAFVAYI